MRLNSKVKADENIESMRAWHYWGEREIVNEWGKIYRSRDRLISIHTLQMDRCINTDIYRETE